MAWLQDRRGWHVRDDGQTYALARRLPARWDVRAETRMPDMGRRRLAHAVRQDLWRMLRRVRGFAPMVEVVRDADGVTLRAGGTVAGAMPSSVSERVAALLSDPAVRAAWLRSAGHR